MTTNDKSDRLDRIEKLVESNAKSIEALSSERLASEAKLDRDRARLYESMADLASAQASLAQTQVGYRIF